MARKILLVANTDWYLFNFRLSLARTLQEQGWEPVLVSPSGPYAQRLKAAGFRWLSVPMSRRGAFPYSETRTLLKLGSIYRHERPDLVHHHTIKPVMYGTLAARWSGVDAVVNSITGLGYLFSSHQWRARFLRLIVKPALGQLLRRGRAHMIFENSNDRAFFIKRGLVQSSRSTLIEGVGVDLTRYQPSDEADGTPLIIMASRMLWDKGVHDFVEAARMLQTKGLSARFALVGAPDSGNPASIPIRRIERWTEQGHVEWWGHQDNMAEVLRSSHVVALPSYFEGAPTVLMEAAASGRPIVATDIPGNRNVVIDGQSGYLVPVGDPSALARSLEDLITSKDLRIRMGKQGREIAERRFAQEDINARTIQLYNEVLSGAG